jgi:uncharacterized protein YdhG (YjbR/CyaY superfamily)
MSTPKPESIDAYLSTVPETHRAPLSELRDQIRALYPTATEHISYGKPLFKLDGHPLGGFYAAKHHSSLFVWSDTALGALAEMLDGYDTAESTVRFPPDQRLPESLVKAIFNLRAQEIRERWGHNRAPK